MNVFFCSLNIRMVNLSLNLLLNELKLIAEQRNISDYENKSTKYLIKAGPKPKLGINKNKLKEVKKDFYNLRHEFSKEADKYRKFFLWYEKLQISFWTRKRRDKKKC